MTSWSPDFLPNLEIQYDVNLNESGYKEGLSTRFRKVITAFAYQHNGSGCPTGSDGDAHISVNYSGGEIDVYLNSSAGILQTSANVDIIIFGIQ